MIIAATHENGNIFGHFGHTEEFKIYEIADGKVMKATVVNTMGSGHGALAGLLKALRVNVLICGGIGMGAKNALAEAKIEVFGGVTGSCDEAVESYLKGVLNYDPEAKCDHHDHNHGEDHDCSDHECAGTCGEHGCR